MPYLSYKNFLVAKYGEALYRIPLDLGFGCPNRTGRESGGCTFCPADGARAQQTLYAETLAEQVAEAIDFAKRRYGARKFMAYIQAFTGTFASASRQREIFSEVLAQFRFEALTIGTRPDCLSFATIEYLQELNQQGDVWVDLGVQSVHNRTLEYVNRGHSWECSREAILRLHKAGIKVIPHVILGLPGESFFDFMKTAELLAELPISGIKIHNLHIVKDTQLALQYANERFVVFNEHEYSDVLIEFLRRIPRNVPIVRLQTDTPSEQLVAPIWNLSKAQFISMVVRQMQLRQVVQGDLIEDSLVKTCSGVSECKESSLQQVSQILSIRGPTTPIAEVEEAILNNISETSRRDARLRFIDTSQLATRGEGTSLKLLDVGFGDGAKSLEALRVVLSMPNAGSLEIHALEVDRGVLEGKQGGAFEALRAEGVYSPGECNANARHSISIHWGDARHTVKEMGVHAPFDLVFLDGCGVQQNSELWTVDFFVYLRSLLAPGGWLLTHNTSLPVLSGLMQAGFSVGLTEHPSDFKRGAIATLVPSEIKMPLSERALQKIREGSVGIPYRDPFGVWTSKDILRHRADQVASWKSERSAG